MKLIYIALLISGFALFFAACAPARQTAAATGSRALPAASTVIATTPGLASAYRAISPADAKKRIDAGEEIILLDVRTPEEYAEGHIAGSVLLPLDEIDAKAGEALKDKDAPIFVYCRSGRRSKIAAEALVSMGYTEVYDLGGIIDWPYGTTME